ncbi:MAG: hypothetical protein K0U29_04500 [Gammaproteobacteria bacterium]|nr:hypothetical protein [Gammaproteobacteria bacterium]MCH9744176.1 hypothetical protein [Gammaproteobacteria bacterium]
MKKSSLITRLLIGSIFCISSTLAVAAPSKKIIKNSDNIAPASKPIANIQGNPIGKKDNYTLNSNKAGEQTVECVFINSGDKSIRLKIRTNPTAKAQSKKIRLSKGSTTQPFQLMQRFHLQLAKHRWCHRALPAKTQSTWDYCAYFSVSDAKVSQKNPFTKWSNAIHSNTTSYNCRLKKPGNNISFFYFK